jgi:hypothetical protein
MSRVIIYLALFALAPGLPIANGQIPDVVSPLVSYQYLDSLSETPEQPNIVSPLVSYQYLDWLGDENLAFEFSPVTSYYFGGGVSLAFSGIVRDANGLPINGAEVILQRYNTVFWQGVTGIDGTITTANLPAGNFNLVVKKSGYTSLFQSVQGNTGGPLLLNLTMHPTPGLPSLITVDRTPADTAIRPENPAPIPGTRHSNLRVFNGSAFSDSKNEPISPSRMTVVITHGLWSHLDDWAVDMASKISANHILGQDAINIVGWDWRDKAGNPLALLDKAAVEGENLGISLYQELGADYTNRIHFIGHSAGTIVNSFACDYLHRENMRPEFGPMPKWEKSRTMPHVTLLDHAELAIVFGSNVTTSSVLSWFDIESRQQLFDPVIGTQGAATTSGFKSPFPTSAAWIDNYITMVGLYHPSAVNAYLWHLRLPSPNPLAPHSEAHEWYRESIQSASASHAMGFARAYEKALNFPPRGNGMTAGSVWQTRLPLLDKFAFDLLENPSLYVATSAALRTVAVPVGTAVGTTVGTIKESGQVLYTGGQAVLNGYQTGIEWVGDLNGTAIFKTGQVIASASEKTGNLVDAALDFATSINPDTLIDGSITAATTMLRFVTPWREPGIRAPRNSVSPPQAWIPVRVPANAAFLVFDFSVAGDPAEDQIACAINEQNLFTLPARFAPDDSPMSTDFLDVSAYAGQQVELYFGLVGGTSSGCTLSIDGIRFVTIPTPKLAATVIGEQVRLNWPAAAVGWGLQRNPNLAVDGWEDVPLPESVLIEDGVVTLFRPRSLQMEFFRLRRLE